MAVRTDNVALVDFFNELSGATMAYEDRDVLALLAPDVVEIQNCRVLRLQSAVGAPAKHLDLVHEGAKAASLPNAILNAIPLAFAFALLFAFRRLPVEALAYPAMHLGAVDKNTPAPWMSGARMGRRAARGRDRAAGGEERENQAYCANTPCAARHSP
jgi:hypothetical protein